ncbi:MAG: hypothetical protein IJU02_05730 [Lachnospiraceae bacterium]|nr:hypothetical protein [Lachnospiraceae bacterium]
MKKLIVILMSLVLVATLVGCSNSASTNNETNATNTTNTTTADSFGNYNPAMPTVTYRDEEEKIIDNVRVPDEYEQAATHQGKLVYEDYNTIDYDDDNHAMEKYLVVYTPYGYDSNKEYDIMYLTHGHTGGATTWLGSPTNPYEMKNVLDHLIEDGKVRPMIVVSMTYYDDNKDEETTDYDSQILNAFGKELRNDIIPMVESKYNTYAKSTSPEDLKASRNHRIMGGFSMGGVTTNLQMCESMDYFKYYMPVSGTLYWSTTIDRQNGDAGKKLADSITAQGYGKDDFFVYLSTGTLDFAEGTCEKQFETMKNQSSMFTAGQPGDAGVNMAFGLATGEGHNAHGRETATYNALPVLSALIAREV